MYQQQANFLWSRDRTNPSDGGRTLDALSERHETYAYDGKNSRACEGTGDAFDYGRAFSREHGMTNRLILRFACNACPATRCYMNAEAPTAPYS